MDSSAGDPGDGVPSKRARTERDPYRVETMEFLVLVKSELPDDVYSHFVRSMIKIRRQRNMSIEKCKEIILEILDGQPEAIQVFEHFIQGYSPCRAKMRSKAHNFVERVKACPDISREDFHALLNVLAKYYKNEIKTSEEVLEKVERIIGNYPEFLEEFKIFVPHHLRAHLPNEKSCTSPKSSRVSETFVSFTLDAMNKLDGLRVKATNGRNQATPLKYTQDQNQNHEGRGYSLRHKQTKRTTGLIENPRKQEDDEEHKAEPLLQWSTSRENELPLKVDPSNCKHCTPSYCLLPKNCVTLQSSYQTELGRSILNDSLVSVTSGREDCYKFRTKNQYEENMFKCEDDLFESDMLLQRFRATADFIEDLQYRFGSNVKIQEHLTPLHKRCIEQLYDDSGIDMLDALSESENTSSALAVILSRLNQKIGDFSEARLSLNKMCPDTVANNYYRSLDHCSPSFKQLDMERMSPKALLAEDKQISRIKSHTDIHIHEDVGVIINYAYSRSCSTEDKPMMNWTKLVKAFVSVKFQWPDLKDTVSRRNVCEHCGMSRDFLNNIPVAVLTNEFVFSSKEVESLRAKSNESTSSLDHFDAEVEEGEFIPDVENIQLRVRCLPTNNSMHSTYGHWSGSEEHKSSRDDSNNEVGSSEYFGRTSKECDANRGISCCTLAVLCRLLQVMYERLLVAKNLSEGASTHDSYAHFKEKLCSLIDGSTDNWNFEQHCLKFLGPNSYVLFTLDKLIDRVIKQICKIYPSREDSSVLQRQERSRRTFNILKDPALPARRTNSSKELLHHQNARGTSIELPKQGREEAKGGCESHGDTGKMKQNHFQRRKKRALENGPPSFSQPGSGNQAHN
ncbi:paired amphipathic helix protein Sin3-like 6 isoform X2 [Oryza sativa Japonica Group]|uniref:paired amphipathic helix protein Sin3-like 6 isoform X2 n=1 Tax=Oryza sativa subsp. japonica TaxID=39947 RepID=UPI00077543DB|nr:paired amphipathic helix protein Sin3-like 4 isoform X2 [Oryza sativa Japonica Group]